MEALLLLAVTTVAVFKNGNMFSKLGYWTTILYYCNSKLSTSSKSWQLKAGTGCYFCLLTM